MLATDLCQRVVAACDAVENTLPRVAARSSVRFRAAGLVFLNEARPLAKRAHTVDLALQSVTAQDAAGCSRSGGDILSENASAPDRAGSSRHLGHVVGVRGVGVPRRILSLAGRTLRAVLQVFRLESGHAGLVQELVHLAPNLGGVDATLLACG